MDCLRLARLHPDDFRHVLRCNAQSASMMRQANAARSLLLRVQAARREREANPAACNQDAWTQHCALAQLAEATGHAAPEPPSPPAPDAAKADTWRDLTEAERYAVTYPRRAALIRAHGALPDNCSFGPPRPAVVRDIVTGNSPPARPRPAASPRIRLTCGHACHRAQPYLFASPACGRGSRAAARVVPPHMHPHPARRARRPLPLRGEVFFRLIARAMR